MKNIREVLKRVWCILLFTAITITVVSLCSFILRDKQCEYKNKDFFDEKEPFDVLFFGSSHMELYISPMELWKKYGIVSYNFGSPEEGIPITYHVMKNAVNYNKPKVIVLDMHMFNVVGNYSSSSKLHFGLDSFPLNRVKLESIIDMTETKEEFLEMIFKIGKYHGNWKNLSQSSFKNMDYFSKGSISYGYFHTMIVNPFDQVSPVDEISTIDEDNVDLIYINKIIELCKDNGIELIFVNNPYVCSEKKQKDNNYIKIFAENNNIRFLDFYDIEDIIDMKIDMYDHAHVNQSGMQKVTDYMGSYLKKYCSLENHIDDERYSRWKLDYNTYKQLKMESIWKMENPSVTLEMLHDDDVACYIYIGEESGFKNINNIDRLLKNVCVKNLTVDSDNHSEDLLTVSSELLEENAYYVSNISGAEESCGEEALSKINSVIGEFDINPECAVICIVDRADNQIKVIKKYTESGNNCEILYSDINSNVLHY